VPHRLGPVAAATHLGQLQPSTGVAGGPPPVPPRRQFWRSPHQTHAAKRVFPMVRTEHGRLASDHPVDRSSRATLARRPTASSTPRPILKAPKPIPSFFGPRNMAQQSPDQQAFFFHEEGQKAGFGNGRRMPCDPSSVMEAATPTAIGRPTTFSDRAGWLGMQNYVSKGRFHLGFVQLGN
jgi:hypothetical protein